jgi:hypothetical protein
MPENVRVGTVFVIRNIRLLANIAGLGRTQTNPDSPSCLLDARTRKLTALFSARIGKNFSIGIQPRVPRMADARPDPAVISSDHAGPPQGVFPETSI